MAVVGSARARIARLSFALALATSLVAAPAAAQPSGQDIATAQALFDDGKRLMQAGKFDEGCPKLVESQRLDPGGGTLLVIALCHEGQGKTATAWAEFGVALGEARKDKRVDRENAAMEHIKKLEPKLTRVRVIVADKPAGLEVRRDDTKVGEAQFGTPLPVDPGDHVFTAKAPGKTTWTSKIPVKGEGATIDIQVPKLEDDPFGVAAPAAAPGPNAGPAPPIPSPPRPDGKEKEPDDDIDATRKSRFTWVIVSGGIGIVSLGVGTALGASASSRWDDAKKACPNNTCTNPKDTVYGTQAGTRADIATVLFVVGGLGVASAAVLWLTMPSPGYKSAVRLSPMIGSDGAGLAVGGAL